MRGRFAGGPDALVAGPAYQPKTITEALFPPRVYHYYTPTQERKDICPIGQHEANRVKPIPAIHLAMTRREANPQGGQQPPTLKEWTTMTQDTDAVLSAQAASRERSLGLLMHSLQTSTSSSLMATSDPETLDVLKQIASGNTHHQQLSHVTDFIQTCIYGPGGSACSSVPSELFRDTYLFLSRRGYSATVPIVHSSNVEGTKSSSSASVGGTVKATFMSILNPLLDPKMTSTALNSMLPQELRIYRPPDAASNGDADLGGDADPLGEDDEAHDEGLSAHKTATSSSFLFSKSSKVFRIRPVKVARIDKPVRRGAIVTIHDRLVPTLGGGAGRPNNRNPTVATTTRGRKKAGDGKVADEDDMTLAERFGHLADGGVDEFAIVETKVGAKRGREGEDAQPDDGGDGIDSNADADTNSLSSFSDGDNDDDDGMSDGGGSGDELFL